MKSNVQSIRELLALFFKCLFQDLGKPTINYALCRGVSIFWRGIVVQKPTHQEISLQNRKLDCYKNHSNRKTAESNDPTSYCHKLETTKPDAAPKEVYFLFHFQSRNKIFRLNPLLDLFSLLLTFRLPYVNVSQKRLVNVPNAYIRPEPSFENAN